MKTYLAIGAALSLLTAAASAAEPESCRTVRYADPGWTDIASTNALLKAVIEPLGYKADIATLSVPIVFRSLATNKLDIFLGNWMPAQTEFREALAASGAVEALASEYKGRLKVGKAHIGKLRIDELEVGRIVQIGTPHEVYERPRSRFVADFIGSPPMNFLPCEVSGTTAKLPFGEVELPPDKAKKAEEEGRVGDFVDDRRATRYDPVLDAQMGRTVLVEADQRPIPTPDGAVVQPQVGQSLRLLVLEVHGQQNRIVLEVFQKYLEQRLARIAGAEGHPPGRPVRGVGVAAHLHGLLEQGNAGLIPQVSPEQIR